MWVLARSSVELLKKKVKLKVQLVLGMRRSSPCRQLHQSSSLVVLLPAHSELRQRVLTELQAHSGLDLRLS